MISNSLMRRRSRLFVALLAVAIGATILSGMVAIYYDIPRQMGQEFRPYGANLILVPGGDSPAVSVEALDSVLPLFPTDSVVGIAPYRYQMAKINDQPFMAAGTEFAEARLTSPYWFVNGDWPEAAGEVLLGQEIADYIRLLPGSTFTLTGLGLSGESFSREFTVRGVLQTGGTEESFVYMGLEDFDSLIGAGGYDVVECSISAPETELDRIASAISAQNSAVSPRLVRRVTQSEGTVLTKLQALVYLVTVIVLLLTMICVATTMTAEVTTRRREIGLKKALGASGSEIIREFLVEGVVLGALGGLLGALLGYFFAQLVSLNVFTRSVSFPLLLVPLTTLVSVVITGVACLLPVQSAAEVDPAIVLRGE
jgi:putative ABC transport system permease protein